MNYLFFDLRALALMRIGLALVLILDLSIRITDLEAFYSNSGAVPLSLVFEHAWNPYYFSFHTMSGLKEVQFVLFLLAYFFAFLLLIGYRTTLATFLSWMMLVSLHNRNVLILQGGDDLLRMVLFWGMFLPLGARYSYDHQLAKGRELPGLVRTPASIAYLLQIVYIYTGSALLKGPEWDTDFTALYYVYSLDQIAYPITQLLYPHPSLLKYLTSLAYYFELLVPLLFFIPFKHSFFRGLGVLFIVIFHTFNEFTLLIGLFPYIGIVTCLGILSSSAMDRFDHFFRKRRQWLVWAVLFVGAMVRPWLKWKKPNYTTSWALSAIIIFLTVFTLDWNYSNLRFVKSKLSDDLRVIGYCLRLDQSWGMFAPGVLKEDGWYILDGRTVTNRRVDLVHPFEKLTFEKPSRVVELVKNDRWRKYHEHLMLQDFAYMRGYYCNYRKRIWNEKYPELALKSLDVIYMRELTLPDYQKPEVDKRILWHCE